MSESRQCFVLLLLSFVLAIGGSAPAAAEQWIEPAATGPQFRDDGPAEAPALDIVASDASGIRLMVTVPGFSVKPTRKNPESFITLGWPGAALSGEVGSPALPVIRRLFLAPPGAAVTVQTTTGEPLVVGSDTLGGDFLVTPRQAPVPKIAGAMASAPFNWNRAAYRSPASLPAERAVVLEGGLCRGQRVMLLEIYPLAYNAAGRRINYWPQMAVRVGFKGSSSTPSTLNPLPGLLDHVLNPGLAGSADTAGRATGNYLVVVTQGLAGHAKMTEFISAKTAQGFTVSTYSVPPGTSNSVIKSYIEGLYGGAAPPDYILLVGDSNTIPHWTGGGAGSPHTDLNYVCMDGGSDWYPDIAIGRFPVDDGAELTDVVDKTLSFDAGQYADSEYTSRACFMASVDNYQISEGTHNYVIDTHMDPNDIVSDRLYQVTYGATTQDVRDSFNDGRLFGVYSGHGDTYYWADGPPFHQSDVNNLTNYQMYSWVLSFACITGTYTVDECFMETWLLAADKGAIAAWGSSVNSYWTEDDVLEKRLFDVLFFDGIRELGLLYNATKMVYLGEMGSGSTTRRYFEMYNHLGDPALVIPYGISALRVTPSSAFESGGQAGGPFTPESKTYTLTNEAEYDIDYSVALESGVSWLTLSGPLTGTLASAATTDIAATINANADLLPNGFYSDTIRFTNLTDGIGDTSRAVTLQVGVPTLQYQWSLDSDPGWSATGNWAFGQPSGGGGEHGNPDPTGGHTGNNVLGYNLGGDYPNDMPQQHLTSGAIDCSDLSLVSLKFWRHLNVEEPSYDHAYVRVSNDGSSWTTVWENGGEITDNAWTEVEYDISSVADGQPAVYLRWTMGTTDGSYRFSGWNIDDIEIFGLEGSGGETTAPVIITGPGEGPDNVTDVHGYLAGNTSAPAVVINAYGVDRYGVNVAAGNVDADEADEIITGPGPGAVFGPQVRLFDYNGTPLPGSSIMAYGTNKFGVNVAGGDIDGDGYAEIITGAGPGAVFGPHVRAFDFDNSGAMTPVPGVSYFAYGVPKWGVNVACGDIDGDGYHEIVTGAGPGAVYGPHVRGWNVDGGAATAMPGVSYLAYGTPKFGVNVACGDIDGDGCCEIITGAGPGMMFGSHVRAWNCDGSAVSNIVAINFFAFDGLLCGASVGAGDVDDDGKAELLVGAGPDEDAPALIRVYEFDGGTLTMSLDFQGYSSDTITHGVNVTAGKF